MQAFAQLALWAFIPFMLVVFAVTKQPRRAIIFCFLSAWLFLPMLEFKLASGVPPLSKITVSAFAALLGTLIFYPRLILQFRPRLYDIPMLVWCFCPFMTSHVNDLGAWDGGKGAMENIALWGIPYFIGRLYFNDWQSFRELGMGILIGGLIYVPLCLLEMKFSPFIHLHLYGRHPHAFAQEVRWGGYRPMVCMQSGLAVGMWMVTASLVAFWFWVTGALKSFMNVPMFLIVPVMIVTTIMCKATGALALMGAGLACMAWIKTVKNPLPLVLLMLIPPVYFYQRASGAWDGTWMVKQATTLFGEERAQSLETRLIAENLLSEQAFKAPNVLYGWGKWDPKNPERTPWRVYDDRGIDKTPTDGLWIITLGQFGIVGLTALTVTVLLPWLMLWLRLPGKFWNHPMAAATVPLAIVLVLHMIDNMLNGMLNPIFVLAMGGLSAIGPSVRKAEKVAPLASVAPAGYAPVGMAAPYADVAVPAYSVPGVRAVSATVRPATGRGRAVTGTVTAPAPR